jgi:hypothetical protein
VQLTGDNDKLEIGNIHFFYEKIGKRQMSRWRFWKCLLQDGEPGAIRCSEKINPVWSE